MSESGWGSRSSRNVHEARHSAASTALRSNFSRSMAALPVSASGARASPGGSQRSVPRATSLRVARSARVSPAVSPAASPSPSPRDLEAHEVVPLIEARTPTLVASQSSRSVGARLGGGGGGGRRRGGGDDDDDDDDGGGGEVPRASSWSRLRGGVLSGDEEELASLGLRDARLSTPGSVDSRKFDFDASEADFDAGDDDDEEAVAAEHLSRVPSAERLLEAGRLLLGKSQRLRVSGASCHFYDDLTETFRSGRHPYSLSDAPSVAICVTMFNEEELELRRTLEGIAENVATMRVPASEVVVCIVADGRANMPESALRYLDSKGMVSIAEMEAQARRIEAGRAKTKVHLFENNDVSLFLHTPPEQRLSTLVVIKERNAGKLSSHHWFFEGLCKRVEPEIIMLIDAGTKPQPRSLEALRVEFDENPNVGGTCGELRVFQPRCFQLVNAAQSFEYLYSHIMDKATESMFGFISVLPGAFSAYRYKAVLGRPLQKYFWCEHNVVTNPFVSNMYLAEDRILGFELLAKENCKWVLSYVSQSIADTDVPDSLIGLIKQRRRWLNGAFFTGLYFIGNWPRLMRRAGHGCFQKALFMFQLLYMLCTFALSWFTIANAFLAFYIVMSITVNELSQTAFHILILAYAGLTFVQFTWGLGTKPADAPGMYKFFSFAHGFIMYGTVAALSWYLWQTASADAMFLVGAACVGSYAVAAILYNEVFFVLTSFMQYLAFVPVFVNVIMIFSFCNVHDVSWGTREAKQLADKHLDDATMAAELKRAAAQETRMRRARSMLVSFWLVSNWAFVTGWVVWESTRLYATCVVLGYGGLLSLRVVGSLLYRIRSWWVRLRRACCGVKQPRRRAPRAHTSPRKIAFR